MNGPLVTIVTPSYNQGRFIKDTIESVLTQDYPHIEYIIMDAASTDSTAEVVKRYKNRLTWISEKDRGQSHAINKGFRMAKGEIVAWLNSDDVFLPGAVTAAVKGFQHAPNAGAVYGEGYQIDIDGKVKYKFSFTEKFDLWKLTNVVDYVLQQTVFFRRAALESIGFIDESLHFGMDWDILVKLGKHFGLHYIPAELGCLREYDDAKSFAGGAKRFRELGNLVRKQSGRLYPPGYVIYGLDTYEKIWCQKAKVIPVVGERLSQRISHLCRYFIDQSYHASQGLYRDGWATDKLHYMIPAGSGTVTLRGQLIDLGATMHGQVLTVESRGRQLCQFHPNWGIFEKTFEVPLDLQGRALDLDVYSSKAVVPAAIGAGPDHRRLAFQFREFSWTHPPSTTI